MLNVNADVDAMNTDINMMCSSMLVDCGATSCLVLSCHMYWPTLQWSQTVRDGAHGLV